MRLAALILAAIAALPAAARAVERQPAPPASLTRSGVALWNFEALLRDRFGKTTVCQVSTLHANEAVDFLSMRNGCFPRAAYFEYAYAFADARRSAYRVVLRSFDPGDFGQTVPVRVAGQYVACEPAAKTFLVYHAELAGFALGCLPPRH